MTTEAHDKMIAAFQEYLSGKLDSNTEAQTKQALRHDIGYQKYVMKHQLGE